MPPYADLPVWNDNFDNVGVRLVNAGWNALFTRDLDDFSFKELARDFGAAPQTLYYYFPSVRALGAELAAHAIAKLVKEASKALPDEPPGDAEAWKALSRQVLTSYLAFAAMRPRHYLLIFSPRYASQYEFPELARRRQYLLDTLKKLLEHQLQRPTTEAEAHAFMSLLHGSASLVAAGHPPQTAQLFRTVDVFIDDLRQSTGPVETEQPPLASVPSAASTTPVSMPENSPESTGAPPSATAPASATDRLESATSECGLPTSTADPAPLGPTSNSDPSVSEIHWSMNDE